MNGSSYGANRSGVTICTNEVENKIREAEGEATVPVLLQTGRSLCGKLYLMVLLWVLSSLGGAEHPDHLMSEENLALSGWRRRVGVWLRFAELKVSFDVDFGALSEHHEVLVSSLVEGHDSVPGGGRVRAAAVRVWGRWWVIRGRDDVSDVVLAQLGRAQLGVLS